MRTTAKKVGRGNIKVKERDDYERTEQAYRKADHTSEGEGADPRSSFGVERRGKSLSSERCADQAAGCATNVQRYC
jgi:hypothetical protein